MKCLLLVAKQITSYCVNSKIAWYIIKMSYVFSLKKNILTYCLVRNQMKLYKKLKLCFALYWNKLASPLASLKKVAKYKKAYAVLGDKWSFNGFSCWQDLNRLKSEHSHCFINGEYVIYPVKTVSNKSQPYIIFYYD